MAAAGGYIFTLALLALIPEIDKTIFFPLADHRGAGGNWGDWAIFDDAKKIERPS